MASSLACSVGRIVVGEPTPVPTPVPPTPFPTWTPLPAAQLSPAQAATLTLEAAIAWPSITPTPTSIPTDTPTPTITPTGTATPPADTPTPQPTPTPVTLVSITAPLVNVREGPGTGYPVVGQVPAGESYELRGRNEAGTWWFICCVSGREVWIVAELALAAGPTDQVPVVDAQPPPQPTATAPPTPTLFPTPTPAPFIPFDVGDGPQFFTSTNPWLTIWIKAFTGQAPNFVPVPGYRLRVLRNGFDVSRQTTTRDVFELSAPFIPTEPEAYGNRRQYNLKYEYLPETGDARWTIYLLNGAGAQVSPEVTFETRSVDLFREVYVGFYLR